MCEEGVIKSSVGLIEILLPKAIYKNLIARRNNKNVFQKLLDDALKKNNTIEFRDKLIRQFIACAEGHITYNELVYTMERTEKVMVSRNLRKENCGGIL